MSTSLVEITNPIAARLFNTEVVGKNNETAQAVIGLSLQAVIDSGISDAIPRALYLLMDKEPKDVVSIKIGPFTYGITKTKVGDSITFNPMFELTDSAKLLSELDEYSDDISKKNNIVQGIYDAIIEDVTGNKLLIETVIHCCALDTFNTMTGEWESKLEDADKGIELDDYSAPLLTATHIAAIIHCLAKHKKQDEVVKYAVPGEGTYTITHSKGKFDIGFAASNEFKQAIKNDRLAQKLADEE